MATFPIATGTDDAQETAGVVVTTGASVNNDLDATDEWAGLRFQTGGSGPPQGATITACAIALAISTTGADEPDVTIFGEKVVNSATFTTGASDISARTRTTASVNWSSADLGAAANQVFSTADLSTVMQELVNQASWTPSSAITFLLQGSATAARDLQFRCYEYTGPGGTDPQGTYSAVLTVTWTGGGGQSNAPRSAFYHMIGVR